MRPVKVQFLKNPDILHWGFEGRLLGEDEYGFWMAVPAGSRRWKGEDLVHPTREDAVFCAPRDGWWHLHYNGPFHTNLSHFIDIVTPPAWVSENRYEMIDLDLDVVVAQDGSIVVEDEDEFEINQLKYGYSAQMTERAVVETAHIVSALQAREEPFFEIARAWLATL